MNKKKAETTIPSDYDLINSVSEELGATYKRAVSMYVTDCFSDSLVHYRSCLSILLKLLGFEISKEKSLIELIDCLNDSKKFVLMIAKLMHEIRKAGNKGSHAEEYTDENYQALCKKTNSNFFQLITLLYPSLCSGSELPDFDFSLEQELNIYALSSKALFEGDSVAQYLTAKKLYSNAQHRLLNTYMGHASKETIIELENGERVTRYHDQKTAVDTAIAVQLFDASQYYIPEASYEYGKLLLTDGHWLNLHSTEKLNHEYGVGRIHFAALHDAPDALYLYGFIKLHGLYGQEIDVEYALECLEAAAELNQPKAIFELAEYYFKQNNLECARDHYLSAVQLGSPKAQYKLAKCYMDDSFACENRVVISELLEEATNAGVTEAKLLRARFLADGTSHQFDPIVPNLYEEYINTVPSADIMFEYAQYLISHDESSDVAMYMLHNVINYAGEEGNKKLEGFAAFIISKTKLWNESGKLEIQFPPEALLTLENVVLKKSTSQHRSHVQTNPTTLPPGKKIGRNDQCYCGSGEKYKNCCLH
ncbi:hypothetical protein LCGC14_0501310 [marine sediment metagenome]|uniref:DUF4145 domain-containing protein n=1 Tax=marine sediment metagenome TaxID=412755 RepID=A0A0F9S3R1_9ZZZZ|nr:DUF4145 domain-containing protein [Methylophaga sp.]HEC60563.1 DUF4145 domain-containing protein [Methylophaga sp.]